PPPSCRHRASIDYYRCRDGALSAAKTCRAPATTRPLDRTSTLKDGRTMAGTRCIHGMDSRFCAICNRSSRSVAPAAAATTEVSLADILQCLNDERIRATYKAVSKVLGVPARSVGGLLGDRRPEASWVVNETSELPTGYEQT